MMRDGQMDRKPDRTLRRQPLWPRRSATDRQPDASKVLMILDVEKAGKPLRKARKLLKKLNPEPSPDEVHELRTTTRKLEASLHALPKKGGKGGKRALKKLKAVRRVA